MNRQVGPLMDGDAGTVQTLDLMRGLVRNGVAHPLVRQTAVDLARRTLPNDTAGQVREIRAFLTERMHFVHDPLDWEHVSSPEIPLGEMQDRFYATGDCDDVAVLGAALGGAIGIPARFVVLGFHDVRNPMGHVYSELFDGAQWVDLDVTRPVGEIDRDAMIARTWYYPVWE